MNILYIGGEGMRCYRVLVVLILSLVVFACASKEEKVLKQLKTYVEATESKIEQLGGHLRSGRIRNAKLLTQYADAVKAKKPELREIVDTLALDATTDGAMYLSLKQRLGDAKDQMSTAASNPELTSSFTDELNAIYAAASSNNFNMMLTDPINVLADMSGGSLSRVAAMAKDASLSANQASELGAGSQLVGNPNYGRWQQNSSGGSFWTWYGQYAFFSSLFNGPIGYGSWSRNRDYSYYHDVGRDYYSSPRQKTQAANTEARVKKQFQREGKQFNSPYAKRRTASRSQKLASSGNIRKPSKFGDASNSRFSSPYKAKSSNNNSAPYSSRSSTTSRSYRSGGK